jgi:hypothetical protein
MIEISIRSNAEQVAAELGKYPEHVDEESERALDHAALLLETRIKANASLPAGGPPGPRAITGDYRASWNARKTGRFQRTVGTDRPQARRLEYGFVGADALGRVYNQPPYVHVRPAVDEIGPQFRDEMKRGLRP